jgi:beta-galactosidase
MRTQPGLNSIYLIFITSLIFISCNRNSPREIIALNGEWIFETDSTGKGINENWPEKGVAHNTGIIVQVPHAWNSMHGLEKYWGKAWYEKEIYLSAKLNNKAVRIQFDAVYHDAIIWINGKLAGKHTGSGYNRFYINADSLIQPGALNRITVLVDNSPSRYNIPFNKSFDWSNDGGIIRGVYLIKTEKEAISSIHINGVPNINKTAEGIAKININFLDELKGDSKEIVLTGELIEFNQETDHIIWKGKLDGSFSVNQFKTELRLRNIKYWHFDQPNLYKLTISLKVKGILKDELTATFGFRTIEVSSSHFMLNGEPIKIAGIEWMPGSNLKYGMAEPESELARNLELMKKVNAVFTRFHWEQDEYIFEWCDRNGILVQEEIPYWGGETKLNDSLYSLGKYQLKEMLDAHYNHPCIISWGIGNELAAHDSTNIRFLKGLHDFAGKIDSSRLVNYVSNQLNVPIQGKEKVLPDASAIGNVLMFNEYFSTWYNQIIDSIPSALDRIHADYPNKALVISEFGICEPVFKGGDQRRKKEMKEQFRIYGEKPYVAGAIYFCLNDYRTHMGEDFTYSYPQRVHGVADINLNPKPSYSELKNILSPLEIISIRKQDGIARISLRCKTGVPAYSVRNYFICTSKKKLQLSEMKPGDGKLIEIAFRKNSDTLEIIRPTGFEVIKLPI